MHSGSGDAQALRTACTHLRCSGKSERRKISRRTKDALAAAKRRGASKLTAKARKGGQEANTRIAYVSPVIAELQAAGATSLRAIAADLNARLERC